jgi:hypothetical protein
MNLFLDFVVVQAIASFAHKPPGVVMYLHEYGGVGSTYKHINGSTVL